MDQLPDLSPVLLSGLTWEQALNSLRAVDCAVRRAHWCSPVVILDANGRPVIDDDGEIKPLGFMPGDKRAADWSMVARLNDKGDEAPVALRPTPAGQSDESEGR